VRRAAAALCAGALLLGLTACQDDEPPADDGLTHYVALGDSYTAAPAVPVTDPTNPCFRSDHNYPSLIAAKLPLTELVDVSCSGATTAAMTTAQNPAGKDVPPQFDALDEGTDLVTLGIGGNDQALFLSWATECAQVGQTDPEGSPCADDNQASGGDEILDLLPQIQENVTTVIEGVQDRAPDARVIVVPYPRILPDEGTCPELVPFAEGDYAYINSIIEGLDDALVGAAKDTGVEWVDVYQASRNHDICAEKPWVNGFSGDQTQATILHPFAAEQAAVAQLILDKL
jgi:lysophospholipase L1-like esterase